MSPNCKTKFEHSCHSVWPQNRAHFVALIAFFLFSPLKELSTMVHCWQKLQNFVSCSPDPTTNFETTKNSLISESFSVCLRTQKKDNLLST